MLNVAEAINIISNAKAGRTVQIIISEEDASNADLITLLGTSGVDTATSGTYLVSTENDDTVIVNLVIANDKASLIEIKVAVNANDTVNLNSTNWTWKLADGDDTATINWGDESIETISDTSVLSHTYSSISDNTERVITISNIFFTGETGDRSDEAGSNDSHVTEINFVTPQIVKTPVALFANTPNLQKISGTIKVSKSYNGNSIRNMFAACPELTDISNLIVEFNTSYSKSDRNIHHCFNGCTKITADTIEKFRLLNFDITKVSNYNQTFNDCKALTHIPQNIVNNSASCYDSCFRNTSITYVPAFNNLKESYFTFCDNPNLKYISPNADFSKLTNGDELFTGCSLCFKAIERIYKTLTPFTEVGDAPKIFIGVDINEPRIQERIFNLCGMDKNDYTYEWIDKDGNAVYDGEGNPIRLPHAYNGGGLAANGWRIEFDSKEYPFV